MNDEIKEILNNADSSTRFKIVDEDGTEKEMNIAGLIEKLLNDNRNLIDYITNLQEELKYQEQAEQEYNEKHTKLMKKHKKLQERNEKAIEDIDKFISGYYIEGKGDITVNYLVPNPCCEDRLNIIKKDLLGENNNE